jgi:hypothetical protein
MLVIFTLVLVESRFIVVTSIVRKVEDLNSVPILPKEIIFRFFGFIILLVLLIVLLMSSSIMLLRSRIVIVAVDDSWILLSVVLLWVLRLNIRFRFILSWLGVVLLLDDAFLF